VTLARRRRLGPYRPEADREARREKDLAALARAGFGYDIARTVIEASDIEALETLTDV
jgi:regulatory protein